MARVRLALIMSGLLATQVHAQAATSLVDHWDAGLLVDALHGLDATDIRAGAVDGRPTIAAVTRDGLNAGLMAKGCDSPPPATGPVCHAMAIVITFNLGQRPDRATVADQLNHGFAIGKFTLEADGTLRLTRYILFDGGVSQDNLRAELNDTFTAGALVRQTLWPAPAP